MRWLLYNLLFTVVYLALLPGFFMRMRRRGGYANRFADRFGRYPGAIASRLSGMKGPVWIHAVSVGEVYVAAQMMRALRERLPGLRFVFSSTSSTGWREAEKQLGPDDALIYNPLDFPACARRALRQIRPSALILTESEIWPNLIRACHSRGIPMFLINARVSDRSASGYRRLRFWFRPILRMFTAIQAQSALDASRLVAAGADPARIQVTGSFKYDVAARARASEREIADFLARHDAGPGRLALLGGSIWPGEDAALLRVYARLLPRYPDLRLVLVPRHFEKADAVEAAVERAGFRCVRKSRETASAGRAPDDRRAPALVGDTTGELMGFYGNADLVFVGKSLCEHGAQNMIEPCLCGVATLVGPHTENFRSVMSDLLAARAIIQVPDEEALTREIERLVADASARRELGARAAAAVESRRGVVARCADEIAGRLRVAGAKNLARAGFA